MESTGVFWKPVYAALEGHVEIVVGNAQHIRNVPGRKTDIKDAEWQLLRHGLIRASFVPPPEFRELRELLRFRRGMVQEPAQSDDSAPGGSRHQAGGGGERRLRGVGAGHAAGAALVHGGQRTECCFGFLIIRRRGRIPGVRGRACC